MNYPPDQQQRIESIATLCPVVGGPAVYKARAMMVLFNDSLVFHDDSLCAAQGYAYRLIQGQTDSVETFSKIAVYPNPSLSNFTVYTGTEYIEELKTLRVYNALGQMVLTNNGSGNQFELDFAALSLARGVYTLQVEILGAGRNEYFKLVHAR